MLSEQKVPSRDLLAESQPLPDRLHLSHTLHTPKDQRANARLDAVFFGLLAIFPALVVSGALKALHVDRETFGVIAIAIILGVAIRTYWKGSRDRTQAFEQNTWLDFTDRFWRSRKVYAHDSMPAETANVPFKSLVLACYSGGEEEDIVYIVSLCQFSDLDKYGCAYRSEWQHSVYVSEDEKSVLDYALRLAELWGLDCWHYALPSDGGLQKIFPAKVPAPSAQGIATIAVNRTGKSKRTRKAKPKNASP